jgi:hypothetical protein
MRTRFIAEALVAADASGRMQGLADCQSGYSTRNLVECAFDIDVRRWHASGLLLPDANFLCHWMNGEDEPVSLGVRVESDSKVWLTYRVRVPNKGIGSKSRRWSQWSGTPAVLAVSVLGSSVRIVIGVRQFCI